MSFAHADIDKIKASEEALHTLRTIRRNRKLFNFQIVILEKTLGRRLTMEDIRGDDLWLHWEVKLPSGTIAPTNVLSVSAAVAPKLEASKSETVKPKEQSFITLILLGVFGFMIFVPAKLMPILFKVLLGGLLSLGALAIITGAGWLGVSLVRFILSLRK